MCVSMHASTYARVYTCVPIVLEEWSSYVSTLIRVSLVMGATGMVSLTVDGINFASNLLLVF